MSITPEQWAEMKRHVEAAKSGGAKVLSNMSLVAKSLESIKPSEPDPEPEPTARFPGDPGVGAMYFGCNVDGGQDHVLAWEQANLGGDTVGLYRAYYQAHHVPGFAVAAQTNIDAGRYPVASFKLPGSWGSVAAGEHDGWLNDLSEAVAGLTGPAMICLHHEPREDGDPADFRGMYARATPILKQASNLVVTPILNGWSFEGHDPQPLEMWATPDADISGIDIYPRQADTVAEVEDKYGHIFDQLATWGKPIVLAEYAFRLAAQGPTSPQLLAGLYDYCLGRGDIVAMSFFNSAQNIRGDDGTMELSGEILQAFHDLLLRPTSVHL